MTPTGSIVYLVDVDNTLIDNDGFQQDLKDHLERAYGLASRLRYWKILEDLFAEVGYRDYLGALQRYRSEHPRQVELLSMSSFLIDLLDYDIRLGQGNLFAPPRPVRAEAIARARPEAATAAS